jgi:hypothetical protein
VLLLLCCCCCAAAAVLLLLCCCCCAAAAAAAEPDSRTIVIGKVQVQETIQSYVKGKAQDLLEVKRGLKAAGAPPPPAAPGGGPLPLRDFNELVLFFPAFFTL